MNSSKIGVLLVNLGTPDSYQVSDVRKYLREFLLDPRVIDINAIGRWLLVNLIIAPFRAPKSAKVYKEVWDEKGSPLLYHSQRVSDNLQAKLGDEFIVRLGMRYQNPSIRKSLNELLQQNISKLIVVPLFPQYASATTGSVHEKVMEEISGQLNIPEMIFIKDFYNDPAFIEAFAQVARQKLTGKDYDLMLFSYHGLPERQIYKSSFDGYCQLGDCCQSINEKNHHCYRAQCFETSRLLAKALDIPDDKYKVVFQSRLGKDPWIQPYAEDTIKSLPGKGVKNVAVMVPSFVADCLETIIEVGEEYKEVFEEAGGTNWFFIESLNDRDDWIEFLKNLVIQKA